MSDLSINTLIPPVVTSDENPQPGALSRPAINNTLAAPSSNTPSAINTLSDVKITEAEEITGETFIDYMHNIRPHDQRPRTFRGLNFSDKLDCKPGAFNEPLIFNSDTFYDLNFRGYSTRYPIEMKNAVITAETDNLIWHSSDFNNSCWKNTSINGSVRGRQGSMNDCVLSQTDMSGCKLTNLRIVNNTSPQIEQANFSNCEFDNIIFSSGLKDQYQFKNVSFNGVQAGKFVLDNVNCLENVDFTNAKIDKFSPMNGTQLSVAMFSDNAPELIKLDPDMFRNYTEIDRHLDRINNNRTGALFFKTLASINNNAVRCAFAEQLVAMLESDTYLSGVYNETPSLQISILGELTSSCYANSTVIRNFISRELLKNSKDALLSDMVDSDLPELFMALPEQELLDYQFPINQLIAEHPELRAKFYQQTPIKDFVSYIEKVMMMEDADAPHQIFYNPKNKTALYLPAKDFSELLHASETPEGYALLQYQAEPGKESKVTDIPAALTNLSSVLEVFPMLHSLWSRSGGIFTPVIRFLFSHVAGLDSLQKNRAAKIEKHMVSLLMRRVDASSKLIEPADESLLCDLLEPFYRTQTDEDRDNAKALRWKLIEVGQHRLALSLKDFSDAEQKIIAGMIIIRMLADLFSTRFYAEEEDSANAPRQLAKLLIDDLQAFRPGMINPADAEEWKERLIPKSVDKTYPCSAIVAAMVASYQFPGERGVELNKAIKHHYPLK
nr:hypothetical protein [Pantoea cypripedii]